MVLTAKLVLRGALLLCGALVLFYGAVTHSPALAANIAGMGVGAVALVLAARWFFAANRRNLWRWFGYVTAGGVLLLAVSVFGAADETPEQAHAERAAREMKFFLHATHKGLIPPDSQAVICDAHDRIIGYENFERNVIIYDGKENEVRETCW